MAEKPSVLIVGGLGYIGRFLALHIQKNGLASEMRIVDKMLPQLAWLAPEFNEACSKENFMQADASKDQSLPRIFTRSNGKEWDYVFNCGGETRNSQEDEVYKVRSLALSIALGKEAAKRGVKAFVELSTGMVYKPDSQPSKEGDKLKPWSKIAVFKLQAEEALAKIEGLNLIIVRLAHVYGDYTSQFVATALSMARVYQHHEEEMKWLWTKDLRVNTVHISDVARGLFDIADWYSVRGKPNWDEKTMGKIPTFNMVDHGQTSQGTMAEIIGQLFGIKTGFQGQLISTFARLNMDSVVDDVNDDLLGPWAGLLEDAGITRPGPLTPFMEKELLKDTDLSMDGSRLEKVVGFKYDKPQITKELVQETIDSYIRIGWWPEAKKS
ncbi:NAD(P)-binding Rossmann-fold containing protein [Glarea lozoyensis ATCC 20868]|uniref:NAD(P)-binding Rossmann-fold containing protein n=1 Tax=Glarea lozoyensis (strain ATCC 20868 / MF5171) TaxID=1116229 RepID=S3DCB9_GLAL2|nr:NAD(P)-binding Rossmann-fold containing protein [Glarea lozoyensis ATCC 20868]EPE29656.1 NAD(P)-binding Rossmann-fold containing protein [Glarea lozoyensis ATCC 20868]